MCCHLDRPIGPRACASVMGMSKLLKASTKIWVGASEPKSTSVPAQSKMTACRLRAGWWECWFGMGISFMVKDSDGNSGCCCCGDEIAAARALQCALHQVVPTIGDTVIGGIGAYVQLLQEGAEPGDGLILVVGMEDRQQELIHLRIVAER